MPVIFRMQKFLEMSHNYAFIFLIVVFLLPNP